MAQYAARTVSQMDMASSTSMVGVEKERRAGRKRHCAFVISYI
jgi:hypothetical protein